MPRTYKIHLKRSALKIIESLEAGAKRRIWEAIESLATEPRPRGCRKISGPEAKRYRIRVGDYRIIYRVNDDQLIILVVRVGHRREIYRDL